MTQIIALAAVVKQQRKKMMLSIKDAAKLAEINENHWSRFERGKVLNPNLDTLQRITEAVNLTLLISAQELPF